mmetsp:Transcript_6014/g.20533  ORF Transcript_6014/g.20533 Transcript_6014/m.20533 type:complete len:205 (-) Transcript_6014:359-973(-)
MGQQTPGVVAVWRATAGVCARGGRGELATSSDVGDEAHVPARPQHGRMSLVPTPFREHFHRHGAHDDPRRRSARRRGRGRRRPGVRGWGYVPPLPPRLMSPWIQRPSSLRGTPPGFSCGAGLRGAGAGQHVARGTGPRGRRGCGQGREFLRQRREHAGSPGAGGGRGGQEEVLHPHLWVSDEPRRLGEDGGSPRGQGIRLRGDR